MFNLAMPGESNSRELQQPKIPARLRRDHFVERFHHAQIVFDNTCRQVRNQGLFRLLILFQKLERMMNVG
jgi:hypothetical protein